MARIIIFLISIFLCDFIFAACPTTVSPNYTPSRQFPSSWTLIRSEGDYLVTPTSNQFYRIILRNFGGGSTCDSSTSITVGSDSYSRFGCTQTVADDTSTSGQNERIMTAVYHKDITFSCPTGYQLSSGTCTLISTCPVAPPVMCSDGFSESAGLLLGYQTCDRPALKQCTDGSFVKKATGICPNVCFDFTSCLSYARTQLSCPTTSTFDFNYVDPQNMTYRCTTISPTSPDAPANGGNGDGNVYNDPQTPTTGTGSIPPTGSADPVTVANKIADALKQPLGSIERAIRDDTDQSKLIADSQSTDLNSIKSKLDSINSAQTNSTSVLGSKLDNLTNGFLAYAGQGGSGSGSGSGSTPCVPTIANNYCENPHGLSGDFLNSLYDGVDQGYTSDGETYKTTYTDKISEYASNSPLNEHLSDGLFDSFLNIFPGYSQCIPLTFGSKPPWSFTVSCEFSDKFKALFSPLIWLYTVLQLIEILMTGIRPKALS